MALIALLIPIIPADEVILTKVSSELPEYELREVAVSKTVSIKLSACVNLMFDFDSYTNWLDECKEAQLISETSENSAYFYFLYDADFPFKDRYLLAHSALSQKETDFTVSIRLRQVEATDADFAAAIAEHPKAIQTRAFTGSWTFAPKENGMVKVTYKLFLDPAINATFNRSIMRYTRRIARKTLNNFSKKVQEEQYNRSNSLIKEP